MFERLLTNIERFFAAMPFTSATWFVLALLMFFVWMFARGNKDEHSPIKWEHLVIDSTNDRASPYKVGYLIGLVVGTWIVISFADRDKLTYDIFGMYLTFLLGGAGMNSYMQKTSSTTRTSYYDTASNQTVSIDVSPSGKLNED